jgi:hypothetical protein
MTRVAHLLLIACLAWSGATSAAAAPREACPAGGIAALDTLSAPRVARR